MNLGITLADLGRRDDAIKILQDASKLDDNGLKDPKTNANARISSMWHLGKLLIEAGEPKKAIQILHDGVKLGGQEKVYNLLGEAYEALGEIDVAERWYNSAIETNPHNVPAQLMMAKMLAKNVSKLFFIITYNMMHPSSIGIEKTLIFPKKYFMTFECIQKFDLLFCAVTAVQHPRY